MCRLGVAVRLGQPALARHEVGDGGLAARDRAGLVEDDGGDLVGPFQRLAAPDQDAVLGPLPGADHDRGRRGQPERAGAGDDQHRDEGLQRQGEARVRPEDEPGREGERREDEHRRDEPTGDGVGQPLDRGLRHLRLLDQLDDLGQRGLLADARRPQDERAAAIEGRADHLVAGALLDRQALAGQHRLVNGRAALDHDAIDRHLVAGADAQQIARDHLRQRDVGFLAVADDARLRRGKPEQPRDRRAGIGPCPCLQVAAQKDEGDDHHGRFVVDLGLQPQALDAAGRESDQGGDDRAVAVGRRGADGDQRVHVGAAMPRRRPGRAVELPPGPELHRRRQHEHRQEKAGVVEGERQEHRQHQRHADGEADAELQAHLPQITLTRRIDTVTRLVLRSGSLTDLVARARHGGAQVVARGRAGVEGNGGALGGQVDRGRLDPRHLQQRPLDPAHAGGAGHPANRQGDLLAPHAVPSLLDGAGQVRQGHGRRVIADRGALGRQVHARPIDPLDLAERPLDAPHTGGAGHTGDRQAHLAGRDGWRRRARRGGCCRSFSFVNDHCEILIVARFLRRVAEAYGLGSQT